MAGNGKLLDDEAEKLFQELLGIDTAYGKDGLSESLNSVLQQQDAHCFIIIDLLDQVASYMTRCADSGVDPVDAETLDNILGCIDTLARETDGEPHLVVRYCGYSEPGQAEEVVDYELVLQNLRTNSAAITAMVSRYGEERAGYVDIARRAFETLAHHGVMSLSLKLSTEEGALRRMPLSITLQVLARFRTAVQTDAPIVFTRGQKTLQLPVISDAYGVPSENLTLLSAVNGIAPQSIAAAIAKLQASGVIDRYLGSYEALVSLHKKTPQLSKPPLEVNNFMWLMADADGAEISPEQAQVARLAVKAARHAPLQAASMIQAVYGDDYEHIDATRLGHRLNVSTGLLNAVDEVPEGSPIESEILNNLEHRLDVVADKVFDDLFSKERLAASGGGDFLVGLNDKLRTMVSFYKRRCDVRRKLQRIVHADVDLTDDEYEALAKDYRISAEDSREMIRLLRTCFSGDGRFSKRAFQQVVSVLKRYEEKILEFLWKYLMEGIHEDDRIVFLNALQLLIAQMAQPKRSIGILLSDFYRDSQQVKYSDAKALMLCSLLVRRYTKALVDVEMTPEEVLQIDDSVDTAIAGYVAWKIDRDQKRFFEKIQTIHQLLIALLNAGDAEPTGMSPETLLELERESYLFLALVGGLTARSVILSAIKEYGDPESVLYQGPRKAVPLSVFMKNLRVAVRGLARVGKPEDISLLDLVHRHSDRLNALDASPKHHEQVKRILEWTQMSTRIIGDG
ncbi:MAG: hypothetical protein ABIL58_18660 [Pseudomonadota bacterium]